MRIGVSLSSSLTTDDPSQAARWMIERARAANRVELDLLSLGDHHAMSTPYYQNTPMLGRLLAEWGPRPVGCLFLLPLWNPLLVAEHIGTLAALSDAPFVLQTGIGFRQDQFAAMNAGHGTRGAVLEESIRVVRGLLAGEVMESDLMGGPASIGLIPRQKVEWWLAGGPSRTAIERAARLGDAWYGSPALSAETAVEQLRVYTDACAGAGRPARPIVRKDVVVLAEPGAARKVGTEILTAGYRGLDEASVLLGTPAEVADQLAPFADLGFTDVVCRCLTVPQSQAIESIELLAEVRQLLT
jgi:alkanesulfonate monooxygenase SsuD/methylene tetrahydromethanopterin reductase-like flavin-dependent oxidoreductase (luciferase family)